MQRRLGVAALIAAAVVLIAFRLHAFDLPLETDECNYAYIGARLLAGDRLYVDVWDHQPFGVFSLFAGVIAVFGDAPYVFRCLAMTFSLASLVLLYGIIRRCAGLAAAITGAVLFALASSDPGTAGEGCNREIYMNTFVLAAWYLALRGGRRHRWMIFLSGLTLGVGSTLKTILAVHWVFLALWIAITTTGEARPGSRLRSVVTQLALFAAGPAIVWLGAVAYFALTDRLDEFIDAVFLFNLGYSGSSESYALRFVRFLSPPRHPFIFSSALPLWIASLGAFLWLLVEAIRNKSRGASAVLALILGSYLAVCLPGRFWPHYYYLLVPAAVIAVSVALGELAPRLSARVSADPDASRITSLLIYAVFPVCLLITEYRAYLSQPPFGITVNRYNSRDFWGRGQGEKVRGVTDPDDEIFVFGNEAEIYYYAQRRCASRYTMITGLSAGMRGAEKRRAILMSELRERLPRLIIVLFDEKPFPEWEAFLLEHYTDQPIGWDRHDKSRQPIMFVLSRKDQPIEPINWDWDRSEVGGWFPGGAR
jgi:hypothetical protein